MRVKSSCLKDELLAGKHIFKTPKKSGADLFVDAAFRELVEENGLKGLIFEELPMVQ